MAARRMTILVMAVALSAFWAAQAHAGAVTYTYDANGRLVSAASQTRLGADYAYDPVGNRESLSHFTSRAR